MFSGGNLCKKHYWAIHILFEDQPYATCFLVCDLKGQVLMFSVIGDELTTCPLVLLSEGMPLDDSIYFVDDIADTSVAVSHQSACIVVFVFIFKLYAAF